jgi:hypothetical protein
MVLLSPISLRPNHHQHTILSEHSDNTVNPFRVLQVRQDATVDEVRNHYRRLALWHHPGRRKIMSISSVLDSSSVMELQRRAHVFCVLAACYETLVDYREEYNACLHNTTTYPPQPPPPPLKGRVLVGGKRLVTVFGSSSPIEKDAASRKQCCSTCEEEEECLHDDGTTTTCCHEDFAMKKMYHHGGPLALLYRARHYTPFTDPFTVFEQAFGGRAVLERPMKRLEFSIGLPLVPCNDDWECWHTTPPPPVAAAWTNCTKIEKDGSIVNITSRTLHGILISKTETKTVDKEGKTRIHIQVTSEPAIDVCTSARQEQHKASQNVCCHCTKMNNNSNNKASQDDDELSLCSWPELSELSSPCNWLFPSSE